MSCIHPVLGVQMTFLVVESVRERYLPLSIRDFSYIATFIVDMLNIFLVAIGELEEGSLAIPCRFCISCSVYRFGLFCN